MKRDGSRELGGCLDISTGEKKFLLAVHGRR